MNFLKEVVAFLLLEFLKMCLCTYQLHSRKNYWNIILESRILSTRLSSSFTFSQYCFAITQANSDSGMFIFRNASWAPPLLVEHWAPSYCYCGPILPFPHSHPPARKQVQNALQTIWQMPDGPGQLSHQRWLNDPIFNGVGQRNHTQIFPINPLSLAFPIIKSSCTLNCAYIRWLCWTTVHIATNGS